MDKSLLNAICREDLTAFAQKAFQVIEPGTPFEYNWHVEVICEHLMGLTHGIVQDLIINIPPRFLKSVITAQIYPAWLMGRDPSSQVIGASYAHSLAERNVMKCRQIMQSEWYMELFPRTIISKDQNQKDYFTTTQNGAYKGTGIGGTITGFGCNVLIVDDPINPREAVSDTIRTNAIDEIRSTLFSRFNDYKNRKFVMIMQRLHDDDPTGNLIKDGGYTLLKLPVRANEDINISFNGKSWSMSAGDYLSPRMGKESIDKLRQDLGEYHFAGQYLQEPVPIGGGELLPEWLQYYSPAGAKPQRMNVCILVDAAGGDEVNKKKKKLSDWTAMAVIGLAPDNNYYLLDMIRDRLNPTERVETLFMLHRKWNDLCGKPPKVGYEKYGMMTDTHYIKEKQKQDAYMFPLIEIGGSMAKEERIRRLIPDMQRGRWYVPHALTYIDGEGRSFDLVKELKTAEMATFPRAKHDDMLDAISRIYETDLQLIFPKPGVTMVQRAIRSSGGGEVYSWTDY